jgi:hypothetical protein
VLTSTMVHPHGEQSPSNTKPGRIRNKRVVSRYIKELVRERPLSSRRAFTALQLANGDKPHESLLALPAAMLRRKCNRLDMTQVCAGQDRGGPGFGAFDGGRGVKYPAGLRGNEMVAVVTATKKSFLSWICVFIQDSQTLIAMVPSVNASYLSCAFVNPEPVRRKRRYRPPSPPSALHRRN